MNEVKFNLFYLKNKSYEDITPATQGEVVRND